MFDVAFLDRKIVAAIDTLSSFAGPHNFVFAPWDAWHADAPNANVMVFVYNNCEKAR